MIMAEQSQDGLNFVDYSSDVCEAIKQVCSSDDPLDDDDFNAIDYINSIFPTEQSLSNIEEVVARTEQKIATINNEISAVVRRQIRFSQEGEIVLSDMQHTIKQLFGQIQDIQAKASKSQNMVREITFEIKQLDVAKKNLTLAITTLNHLHMLVGGVEQLQTLMQNRNYGEVVLPLQAITEVMQHFESYVGIAHIRDLNQQVKIIHQTLADQINAEFREAFGLTVNQNNQRRSTPQNTKQLSNACRVVSILQPSRIKDDLLHWFVNVQLQEYNHLFAESENTAWLDKIDKRYGWLKRHLLDFENKLAPIFPAEWEVSERIAAEFCTVTAKQLTYIMNKRRAEIDCKSLLYAIQKTVTLEILLNKKFTGVTLASHSNDNTDYNNEPFTGLIAKCFVPFLDIYIANIDSNLADLLHRFEQEQNGVDGVDASGADNADGANILPSCPELFVFYKKSLVQCTQLDSGVGAVLLQLSQTFHKYLLEYADRMLMQPLKRIQAQAFGMNAGGGINSGSSGSGISTSLGSTSSKISTALLMQNFQYLLRDGDTGTRLDINSIELVCCILSTAEYCLDTTVQLRDKLVEKISAVALKEQVDYGRAQDEFNKVIITSIDTLVQDFQNACAPALTAMQKTHWQNVTSVGDQSAYISNLHQSLTSNMALIRERLSQSRKYFVQLCLKFASSFIGKYINTLYKCKPLNTEGAEQLLLDTHMLKTLLLSLPTTQANIDRPPPTAYTKLVNRELGRAEMILKLVMASIGGPGGARAFVEQYRKLMPDNSGMLTSNAITEFTKLLDMKNVKRQDQTILLEEFRNCFNTSSAINH